MEKWKEVAGFATYEVSNLGRARSVDREIPRKWKGRPITVHMDSRKRYGIVTLKVNSKTVTRLLHILVAKAFIPNPKHLPQVNHKDGIKMHCEATNLEWRTCLGNHIHAVKNGLTGDGLFFDKRWGTWTARYSPKPYIVKFLGSFPTRTLALAARRKAVAALKEVL